MTSIKTMLLRFENTVTWKMPLFYTRYFYKNSITHWKLRQLLNNVLWAFRYLLVSCYFVITSTNLSIYFNYLSFARKKLTRTKKKRFYLLKSSFWNTKRQKRELSSTMSLAKKWVSGLPLLQPQLHSGFKSTNKWLPSSYKYIKTQCISTFLTLTSFYNLKKFPYSRGQQSLRLRKLENPYGILSYYSSVTKGSNSYTKPVTFKRALMLFCPSLKGKDLVPFFYTILGSRIRLSVGSIRRSTIDTFSSFLECPLLSINATRSILAAKNKVKPTLCKYDRWLGRSAYSISNTSVEEVAHSFSLQGLTSSNKTYLSETVKSEIKQFKMSWGSVYLKLLEQGEDLPVFMSKPFLTVSALLKESEVQRLSAASWVKCLVYTKPDTLAFTHEFYKDHILQFPIPSLVGGLAVAHKEAFADARDLVDDFLSLNESSKFDLKGRKPLTLYIKLPRQSQPLLVQGSSRSSFIYTIYQKLYPYAIERQVSEEYQRCQAAKLKLNKHKANKQGVARFRLRRYSTRLQVKARSLPLLRKPVRHTKDSSVTKALLKRWSNRGFLIDLQQNLKR